LEFSVIDCFLQEASPQTSMAVDYILHNRFEFVDQIGKGTFGKVYLARDLLNERQEVAIKVEHLRRY